MADQPTIILPDGYNGHTVECDAEPIERDGDEFKVRVTGSYLTRWVSRQQWEAAIQAAAGTVEPETGHIRWHRHTEAGLLNRTPAQQADLLAALDAVQWQLVPPEQQRRFAPANLAELLPTEDAQFRAASVLRRFRQAQLPVYGVGFSGQYIAIDGGDRVDSGRYHSLWVQHAEYMICPVSRRVEAQGGAYEPTSDR